MATVNPKKQIDLYMFGCAHTQCKSVPGPYRRLENRPLPGIVCFWPHAELIWSPLPPTMKMVLYMAHRSHRTHLIRIIQLLPNNIFAYFSLLRVVVDDAKRLAMRGGGEEGD